MVVIIEEESNIEPKDNEWILKELNSRWLVVALIFPFAGVLGGIYYGLDGKRGSDRLLVLSLSIGTIYYLIFKIVMGI